MANEKGDKKKLNESIILSKDVKSIKNKKPTKK